jgi:hypothetical protein
MTDDPAKIDAGFLAFIESATKVLREGGKKIDGLSWKDETVM